jgi:GrxC family glutaredoxin
MAAVTHNPMVLPDNLPRPEDDGGADHLAGVRVPDLALRATSGEFVNLSNLPRRTIVYAYPRTGIPNVALPEGWNDIPGARGCTPQALAFQDQRNQISALGADVFGLSTQTTEYQTELVGRLGLSFSILSDAEFKLTKALRLPTMTVDGMVLLKRLTLVIEKGKIEHVFYPVFPPDQAAADVIVWLKENRDPDPIPAIQTGDVLGVVIYTTAQCPYCRVAKELLRQKGVRFTEVDVDREPGAANAMALRSGGRRTVPQIFVGQTYVGGADDLQALDKSGQLAAFLTERGR